MKSEQPNPSGENQKSGMRPGEATQRIMLFALALVFAFVGIAALTEEEYWWAIIFAVPSLLLFWIAVSAKKKAVDAASEAASIVQDLTRL